VADGFNGKVTNYTIEPEDVGLPRASIADIQGGATVAEAAEQVRSVLRGEVGARLDMVLLNAGASFLAAGKVDTVKDGVNHAREVIASGAALDKLEQLIGFSSMAAKA
jgi:anthranilate phosphoribosyltransferase